VIRGEVVAGRPTILAVILVRRLRRAGWARFLIDTGSDQSLIHPGDALQIGLDLATDFREAVPVTSRGIGGSSSEYVEVSDIFLERLGGDWDRLTIPLRIAVPTAANEALPSLLGRDVLRNYRLVFQQSDGVVFLEDPS